MKRARSKVFRGAFSSDVSTFAELEACLQRHADFMVDLWHVDKYPSETKLKLAIAMVWPGLGVALRIGKSLNALLNDLRYKKRRLTAGSKSPQCITNFFKLPDTPGARDSKVQLPLVSASSRTLQTKAATASKSKTVALTAKSVKSQTEEQFIAALYGFASSTSNEPIQLSQVTIASSTALITDDEDDMQTEQS